MDDDFRILSDSDDDVNPLQGSGENRGQQFSWQVSESNPWQAVFVPSDEESNAFTLLDDDDAKDDDQTTTTTNTADSTSVAASSSSKVTTRREFRPMFEVQRIPESLTKDVEPFYRKKTLKELEKDWEENKQPLTKSYKSKYKSTKRRLARK